MLPAIAKQTMKSTRLASGERAGGDADMGTNNSSTIVRQVKVRPGDI